MLASAEQQSESAICIYIPSLLSLPPPAPRPCHPSRSSPINQKYPWRMSPKWVQGEQDKACTMVFLSMTLADFPLGIFLWNAAKVMSFLACKSCALPPFFVFGRIKVLFRYKLSEWTKKCSSLSFIACASVILTSDTPLSYPVLNGNLPINTMSLALK